jgi:hypothetical protein
MPLEKIAQIFLSTKNLYHRREKTEQIFFNFITYLYLACFIAGSRSRIAVLKMMKFRKKDILHIVLGSATIRATQQIINASYNQRQRFFHISPEPWML